MCDLDLWDTSLSPVRDRHHALNIYAKLFENISVHTEVIVWTRNWVIFDLWPLFVTLTFGIQAWVMCVTYCHHALNISARLFENPSMYTEVTVRTPHWVSFLTFDLYVWPWPLGHKPGSGAWCTVIMPWTFVPCYLKISQCTQNLQSRHKI